MTSIRELVIRAIKSKTDEIKKLYGYNLDLTNKVERGRTSWDKSELPAISIFPGTETSQPQYGQRWNTMSVEIRAFRSLSVHENSSEIGEKMLSDMIINILGTVFTLNFQNGSSAIALGDMVTGGTSGAEGRVTLIRVTNGAWGAGNAKGILTLRTVSGEFVAGEDLEVQSVKHAETTTGQLTKQETYTDHVNQVIYTNGGITYPDIGDTVIEVITRFDFVYTTAIDNPYQ
jgi:hypothetical protein